MDDTDINMYKYGKRDTMIKSVLRLHLKLKAARKCHSMRTCGLNNHWRPFISRCGYCDVPYTAIARAETLTEDMEFMGMMANVTFSTKGEDYCLEISAGKFYL